MVSSHCKWYKKWGGVSPNYIVDFAAGSFTNQTTRPNEMWQTDFTYFKIIGWGWYYLGTVLDDFSRKILAWKLYANMGADDVKDLLDNGIIDYFHHPALSHM